MAQLSTIIATEDAGLSVELKKLVRSAGVSVGIVEERSPDDSAVEPDLALIDIRAGASALDKVREFRGRWPAVSIVAIAATTESQLILHAMRAGANEFFECPPDRSEFPATMQDGVGNAIRQAAKRLAALDTKHVCRTLSFFGTKGGTGTTTVAVNCTTELARTIKRPTLIVDFNPLLGQVGLFLNVRPRFTLVDALENPHRLDTAFLSGLIAKHRSGLEILAGSERIDRPNGEDAAALNELLQLLGQNYDFIVIDGGSLTNLASEAAISSADSIYLVANPDIPSVRNTQRLVDQLAQMGIGGKPLRVLLNRTSDELLIGPEQIEQVIGQKVHAEFPSDYATVSAALNAGEPLTLSNHSELAARFSQFTRQIAGVESDKPVEVKKPRGQVLNLF